PYATAYAAHAPPLHLAVWHGLTPTLGLSLAAMAPGAGLFWAGLRGRRIAARLPVDGATIYERTLSVADRTAAAITGATQRGSLPFYLVVILLVMVALSGTVLVTGAPWIHEVRAWDTPLQAVIGALIIIAAIFAARALRRLTAMLLVGVSGYGVGVLFILH